MNIFARRYPISFKFSLAETARSQFVETLYAIHSSMAYPKIFEGGKSQETLLFPPSGAVKRSEFSDSENFDRILSSPVSGRRYQFCIRGAIERPVQRESIPRSMSDRDGPIQKHWVSDRPIQPTPPPRWHRGSRRAAATASPPGRCCITARAAPRDGRAGPKNPPPLPIAHQSSPNLSHGRILGEISPRMPPLRGLRED